MIKDKFIKATNRETLIYKIVDRTIFEMQVYIDYFVRGRLHIKSNKKKLHLGCGDNNIKNFINTDTINRVGEYHVNICLKLPFKNDSLEVIYSSHLVEHIYRKEFIKHIKECLRVLKPGGKVIIPTPGLKELVTIMYSYSPDKKLLTDSFQQYFNDKITGSSMMNGCMHLLFGHKYLYDADELRQILTEAGFKNITKRKNSFITSDIDLNNHLVNESVEWGLYTLTIEEQK